MDRRLWSSLSACAWMLMACGGGGDGGAGESTPTTDPNAPTFVFDLNQDVDAQAAQYMGEILDGAGSLLTYGQLTTDLAHRFMDVGSPRTVAANCPQLGRVSLTLDDRDGNNVTSAGDFITAVFDNCDIPSLGRTVSGTVQVQILAANASVNSDLQARLQIQDALKIGNGPAQYLHAFEAGLLRGSLDVQWSEMTTGARLQVRSSAADDLRITANYDGTESTSTFRALNVERTVRHDTASISSSIAFRYDVGARGGMMRVLTRKPFEGDLNVASRQFQVEAEAAKGWLLRGERERSSTAISPSAIAYTITPAGVVGRTLTFGWGSGAALMSDPRQGLQVATYTDQGFSQTVFSSVRGLVDNSAYDRSCQPADPAPCNVDVLFERQIRRQPVLTEPGAVLRLQFGRAIAADTPAMQFRFFDPAGDRDAELATWDVEAATTRHGSMYEIRPAAPLRHGRQYQLQMSFDGINWTGERAIRDAGGQVVSIFDGAMLSFWTSHVLIAKADGSDTATIASNAPAQLRGSATVAPGRTVKAYQWEQLSGIPLQLSAPTNAQTSASLPSDAPLPVGEALIQLTITDDVGNRDRVRVRLKVGNQVTLGAAMYSENGYGALPPVKRLATGTGSVIVDPVTGSALPRVQGLNDFGTGGEFQVFPANGAALAVGTYADAIQSSTPGSRNGLMGQVYCNTPDSPVSGSFTVLDIARGADGAITRLAIDYTQQCEAGLQESSRGSYRFNSTIPLNR